VLGLIDLVQPVFDVAQIRLGLPHVRERLVGREVRFLRGARLAGLRAELADRLRFGSRPFGLGLVQVLLRRRARARARLRAEEPGERAATGSLVNPGTREVPSFLPRLRAAFEHRLAVELVGAHLPLPQLLVAREVPLLGVALVGPGERLRRRCDQLRCPPTVRSRG
jgi:hypothetical protein